MVLEMGMDEMDVVRDADGFRTRLSLLPPVTFAVACFTIILALKFV